MNSYTQPPQEWDANDPFGREAILATRRFPPMKSAADLKYERKTKRCPGDLTARMERIAMESEAHNSKPRYLYRCATERYFYGDKS